MKCPACGRTLQTVQVEDVSVEVCKGGCGGLWFDNNELKKFDEPHEAAGDALLDVPRDEKVKVDHIRKRSCPKCDHVVMLRRFFNVKRQVEIDECPRCAGVWLDYGELGTIRKTCTSPQDLERATEEYFREVLGPHFAEERVHSDLDASHRITRVFRFLTPRHRFWH
ncbi:MAG: zf-TFIIB domain-containing protein [Sedimentisphaerales bacterium]|nr:zf-TFIIB domain-containing protein [Sedimentisphaerales bacterium]